MFKKYLYRRQLKKAREDLQTIFDEGARRRSFHPDKFRKIEDFLNDKERRVYRELLKEEWALSKVLGQTPVWGSARDIYVGEDDMSYPAATSVKTDNSTKITWDYIEQVDMEARCINGKWGSEKWQWRNPAKRVFYPEGFTEAAVDYGRAKEVEDEETMARVLQEYKDKGYGTSK